MTQLNNKTILSDVDPEIGTILLSRRHVETSLRTGHSE